jgi:cellulose synthase (UDP-forming)
VNAKNGAIWHDQSYFYSIILPNADRFDGATCVGTGVIYRRAALESIGGVPVDTVTEDLHTSLKMHKAGLATAYHPDPVAYGIGESSLLDYYKVRLRWAHGNIHALRHENVLFCKGLSLRQRFNYLLVGLNYLEGWQYLIFYLIPVYSLLTGVPPFEITLFNLAVILVFPLVSYMLVQEFACGFGRFWVNELYSMIRFPVALVASAAVLRNRLSWRPSAKQRDGRVEWRMMAPQLAVIGLSVGAIIYAVAQVWGTGEAGGVSGLLMAPGKIAELDWTAEFEAGYSLDLLLIAGFWALLNVLRGVVFVRKVVTTARRTHADHRFEVPLMVELEPEGDAPVAREVAELSLSVLRLKEARGAVVPPGETVPARLYLPGTHVDLSLRNRPPEHGCFEMIWAREEDRRVLDRALYSVAWHRELFHGQAEFLTPLRALARLLRLWSPERPLLDWRPELTRSESGERVLQYRLHGVPEPHPARRFTRPPWEDPSQGEAQPTVHGASRPKTARETPTSWSGAIGARDVH